MKKYRSLFNIHTAVILGLSLLSSFICLLYALKLYIDFLILSIIIVFPITLTIRESLRCRERALQYLCSLKANLQAMVYCVEADDLAEKDKWHFKRIVAAASACLCEDLKQPSLDAANIKQASGTIVSFIQLRKKDLKNSLTNRLLSIYAKVDESVEYLLSTKRHHTPAAMHLMVLIAIYFFSAFYPASVLYKGANIVFWHLAALTAFKSTLLITFYNVQSLLEDAFNPKSPDAIRLDDFKYREEQ